LVSALANAAQTAAELVAQEAIAALGALRDPAAVAALQALIEPVEAPRLRPRLRRGVAAALGKARGVGDPGRLADFLLAWADGEASPVTAGAVLAARGALEHPGACAALRARLGRPSWNARLRVGCVQGLGASGEAAAIDDVLALSAVGEPDAVRVAACAALAKLAGRHAVARERVRRRLEDLVGDPAMHVRVAAIEALAALGDPAGLSALAARKGREPFGNVLRVLREATATLAKAGDLQAANADLRLRLDELERERKALAARLSALEARLG
jgi:HEAT repeat protein